MQLGHHIAMVSRSTTFPAKSFMIKVIPVWASVSSNVNHSGLVVSAIGAGVGAEVHADKSENNNIRIKIAG
jgi:hypothetical protein